MGGDDKREQPDHSTQCPTAPFGQAYTGLDRTLTGQTSVLIARLRELGLTPKLEERRMVPPAGIEPATFGLQNRCSTS